MRFALSRQRRELIYSVFLIIAIPASMIGSTLWLTSHVKDNFDLELRRKANLANEIVGVQGASILGANTNEQAAPLLQNLIDQTRRQVPELDVLSFSVTGIDNLVTIASSVKSDINHDDDSPQAQFAKTHGQPVASIVSSDAGSTREWLVASPLYSPTGTLLGIVTSRVSLAAADESMAETLRSSIILLTIIVSVVVLLLLNHFKFVEYAELFRKQKELDQLKDDFISIATHELKAPMSVIKGYISMSLEEKLPKQPREMLEIALDQTDRLARLVTDLLDVSRLEQGRTKFNIGTVALGTVIGPIANVYVARAEAKGLKLKYEERDGLPAVMADPDRVSEIFTNLIDNAVKYSLSGAVHVTHSITPTAVVTTVTDNGIGMTPEEQSHLFGRFYRARNADTKSIAGTGLGLWIIKQYAERMGGTITVESEKGKGSSFIVTLPRVTPGV